jgi:AcrR family transcriptional regulator
VGTPEPLIKPPLQRRSQESLERILQAGAELLREAGYEGFTLQEVSRRSGVSVGSIYARATSKEALILAIYERETDRMAEENRSIEETSHREDLSGRALVEALVQEMAVSVLRNAETLRVFMHRAVVDREFWERGSRGLRRLSATFEDALREHRDEIQHPDPDLAIDIAFRFVYDTLARRISHGADFESDRVVSDDVLVRELARAAADYLIGPAKKRGRKKQR